MYPFSDFDPVHCSMSGSNCCFLAYIQVSQEVRFIQVRLSGGPISFKIFPVSCDPHKDFNIVKNLSVSPGG